MIRKQLSNKWRFSRTPPKCWRSDRGGLEGKIVSKNYGQTRATLRKSENPFTEQHYWKSGEESLARGFLKTECLKSIRFWTFDGVRPLLDKGILQKYHTSSSVLTIFVTPRSLPIKGISIKPHFQTFYFWLKINKVHISFAKYFKRLCFFLSLLRNYHILESCFSGNPLAGEWLGGSQKS